MKEDHGGNDDTILETRCPICRHNKMAEFSSVSPGRRTCSISLWIVSFGEDPSVCFVAPVSWYRPGKRAAPNGLLLNNASD